ncbi:MAG: hypothetical protein K2O45_18085 [Oscillospiraceae bacterium]|nr:hypothetical protein [Oscillospiraceae bacterium]
MNKRIRKKQFKRMLRELIAAYDEYEAARERIFRKALQDVTDAHGKSHEEFIAALRRYMEIASLITASGPPPRFLTEYITHPAAV